LNLPVFILASFYRGEHEEQLVAEQLEQLSEPPIGVENPSESLEKEAKVENTFCPGVLHVGHKASSLAQLMLRSSSNLLWQFGQKYSYIGIFSPPKLYFTRK